MNAANLDALATWVDLLRDAQAKKRAAEELITVARGKIEEALGDSEIGTVGGVPVVRYTTVTARRFDQKLAKERIPADLLAACYLEQTSRRFSLVDAEETP